MFGNYFPTSISKCSLKSPRYLPSSGIRGAVQRKLLPSFYITLELSVYNTPEAIPQKSILNQSAKHQRVLSIPFYVWKSLIKSCDCLPFRLFVSLRRSLVTQVMSNTFSAAPNILTAHSKKLWRLEVH